MLPTNNYIDFTIQSSASSYVAPANGWIVCDIDSTKSNIEMYSLSLFHVTTYSAEYYGGAIMPVRKGTQFNVSYSTPPRVIRFFYAEGQKSIIKF